MKTLRTIWKYLFNRKSILKPKEISTKTVGYFIQGHLREMGKNFGLTQEHILEQASWRKMLVHQKSTQCLVEGKCIYCQCGINESLLSDPACEHGCFPDMMGPQAWEQYKEVNHINFKSDESS